MTNSLFDGEGLEFEHIQRLQAANQRAAAQGKLNEIERHLAADAAERERVAKLPRCPACGGALEGRFRKCRHCQSDIAWVGDTPCESHMVEEVTKKLEKEKLLKRLSQQHAIAQDFLRTEFRRGNRDFDELAASTRTKFAKPLLTSQGKHWTPEDVVREYNNFGDFERARKKKQFSERLNSLSEIIYVGLIVGFVLLVLVMGVGSAYLIIYG